MHIHLAEGCKRRAHAMKFVFKPRAFVLKLFHYCIDQSLCHGTDFITTKFDIKLVLKKGSDWRRKIPVYEQDLGKIVLVLYHMTRHNKTFEVRSHDADSHCDLPSLIPLLVASWQGCKVISSTTKQDDNGAAFSIIQF